MALYSELFVYSDQQVACPHCGMRTEIIFDMQHTRNATQVCKCMNKHCMSEFVMIYDGDFDYYCKEPDKQYLFSK